jgi:methylated-DNA-protein-cysteine methyltransferase-like protein
VAHKSLPCDRVNDTPRAREAEPPGGSGSESRAGARRSGAGAGTERAGGAGTKRVGGAGTERVGGAGSGPPGGPRAARVLARVRAIPPGFVRTYGDLSPGAPRLAGAVLSATDEPGLPWHRVVRADGTLAKGERQRRLLEDEGIPFKGERVDMRAARLPD